MVAFGMRNVLGMVSSEKLGFFVVDMKTPAALSL